MKACIIQPPYSRDAAFADEYFAYKMNILEQCGEELDIIVLPEYSDVSYAASSREEILAHHKKNIAALLAKCAETAKRCGALVFVNALCEVDGQYRNTTYIYDRQGNPAGQYFKRHIPPVELQAGIASDYTEEFSEPYVFEYEGLRYGFLTCYDFYFYEAFAAIARKNVDILIGCSLQRSDSHDALEILCRFLAYNTNAWVIRSSVSFEETSSVCGASMVVSPRGEVLANMRSRFGYEIVEFDPRDKHYKPAGFGRAPAAHHEYIEIGRNPWQYRPGGSAIVLPDHRMPYPRTCAHRGWSTVAPENSLPAFGAVVALGAEEIEFDLWSTKDRVLVSLHDSTLERVSDCTGNVWDYTYEELQRFDFGKKHGGRFAGLRIVRFEDILKKFSCHTVMNIHVKIWDANKPDPMLEEITALIRRYDCEKYVYFMTTSDEMLRRVHEYAPDLCRCVGHDGKRPWEIVERAIALGAEKVQLFRPYLNREMVEKAHAHGIRCNVFYADDEDACREYLEMGVDTILTNDYQAISRIVEEYKTKA